jgi:parallel beta-helix repeat protein
LSDSDVRNHTGSGIYADDADIFMEDCLIEDNDQSGVYSVSLCYVDITRSVIRANGWDGIYLENSLETKITDNWIYDNLGVGSYDYAGIYLYGAIDQAQIRNNTICSNNPYGIYSDSGTEPDVVNCIVYDNTTEIGTDDELPLGTVSYSCIKGNPVYPGAGNINTDPLFLNADDGDYHLTKPSGCVDTGKPGSTEGGELDIDGNPRVMGGRVDMGADEDYPHCREADYDDWLLLGKPDCWMTLYQCEGDGDGKTEGALKYRVFSRDLQVLSANWKKKAGDPTLNPCADFDHKDEGTLKYRVFSRDLQILSTYWKRPDPDMPGQCLECLQGESLLGGGSEFGTPAKETDTEQLLDWLAEIWLDPEVREGIGAENWLKLYESLEKDLENQ